MRYATTLEVWVTFYKASGHIELPGNGWFDRMLTAHNELRALPSDDRHDSTRGNELHDLLNRMEGVTLHKEVGSPALEDLSLTFLHYEEGERKLILLVDIDEAQPDDTFTTDFDKLFEGQYDPEELQLTVDDIPYAVVRINEQGQPEGPATVVQPHGEDTPDDLCTANPLPPELISTLLQLAA